MATQKDKPEGKKKGGGQIGNQNAVGNTGGRTKYIETPQLLFDLFKEYTEDAKRSPYLVHDFVGKDANEVRKEKERPLSWVGFECYLFEQGIIGDLDDYEKNTNNSYVEYQPIIRAIKKVIEKDQFEGASAGIYQQNIIARKLGMVDKKDITTDGDKIIPQRQVYKMADGTEIIFD